MADEAGNYYAIAEEALQRFRVGGEQQAQIARAIEEAEVTGFGGGLNPQPLPPGFQLLGSLNYTQLEGYGKYTPGAGWKV